ncbi:hypothetical protein [Actinomadura madurae]|uniref:Uncharacterized protein n=1 Tax=Actinomadura madurae TaxID=1993 RepID=A0A1I5XB75_9ACTN|nr:hypothetical protein [Actinomadura madurae]SFQ29228.1 hypothetical protein SAMN04489713_12652 [Actinomadura madurae]SPT59077.1 Uncharacterised protein [Actinomadura madurae]
MTAEDQLRDRVRRQARQRRNAWASRWALVAATLAAIAAAPAAFGWPARAWLLPTILLAIVALVVAFGAHYDQVDPRIDGPYVPLARQAHAAFLMGAAVGVTVVMILQVSSLWGMAIVVLVAFARPMCTALVKDSSAGNAKTRSQTAPTGAGHAAREGARS